MLLRRMVSTLSLENITVVHDSTGKVFRALTGQGVEIGHLEYRILGNGSKKSVEFYHTSTRPEAQGKGVAGKIVEAGLTWALEQKMAIVPSCSYVSLFMRKNPRFNSSL